MIPHTKQSHLRSNGIQHATECPTYMKCNGKNGKMVLSVEVIQATEKDN